MSFDPPLLEESLNKGLPEAETARLLVHPPLRNPPVVRFDPSLGNREVF